MSEMTTTLAFTLAASKKIESGLAKKFNSLREEIDAVVVAEQETLDSKFGYLKDELKTFIHSSSFIGASGPEGPIGPIGEQGQRGPMGYVGPIGPVGPRGEQGIQGPRGADGKLGRKGDKGDQGDIGPEGPAGRDGIDGKDGNDGEKGERGIIGPVGPKGDVGPQGIQGERGEKGDVGPEGPAGKDSTLTLEKIDQVEQKLYKFVNANKADIDRKISTITYAGGGGGSGGGAVLLYDLDDVDYTSVRLPSNGQALVYDENLKKWKAGEVVGTGGGGYTGSAGTGGGGGGYYYSTEMYDFSEYGLGWMNIAPNQNAETLGFRTDVTIPFGSIFILQMNDGLVDELPITAYSPSNRATPMLWMSIDGTGPYDEVTNPNGQAFWFNITPPPPGA